MLDINSFFARFDDVNSSPNKEDLQPIQDFLTNAGAKFAIDTELSEVDQVIIKGLLSQYEHYNWEVVFEHNEYSVSHVQTLNVWIVDLWQDGSEKIINTWFIG